MSTPRDAALRAIELCISPIPLPHGREESAREGWQDLRIDASNVSRYFDGSPMNVGALNGSASWNQVGVDLDDPVAVLLADEFLEDTDCEWGRSGKPRSHRRYVV